MITGCRKAALMLATAAALLSPLCIVSSAQAECSEIIYDFVPGLHGTSCNFATGAEESWTVPAASTKPTFKLHGADDALGGTGGFLEAELPAVAGDVFQIDLGVEGGASSASRNDEALLIAEGGGGSNPNFVSPEARLLDSEEPGQPLEGAPADGSVVIEWYDRRPYFNLVDPLPQRVIDFTGTETASLSYTGAEQTWTVPVGIDRAAFELVGGEGESTEPRGHVLAGFEVKPGETFGIEVGGPGEDTTLHRWASMFDVVRAAGGDTERANYLPGDASPAEEFWEGGGVGGQPGAGTALIRFWHSTSSGEGSKDPEDSVRFVPPLAEGPSLDALCVVPRLRGMRLRAARRALSRSHCILAGVRNRQAQKRMQGRVVRQSPRAGAMVAGSARVSVVLGDARLPG
jgi:hypothetical protein